MSARITLILLILLGFAGLGHSETFRLKHGWNPSWIAKQATGNPSDFYRFTYTNPRTGKPYESISNLKSARLSWAQKRQYSRLPENTIVEIPDELIANKNYEAAGKTMAGVCSRFPEFSCRQLMKLNRVKKVDAVIIHSVRIPSSFFAYATAVKAETVNIAIRQKESAKFGIKGKIVWEWKFALFTFGFLAFIATGIAFYLKRQFVIRRRLQFRALRDLLRLVKDGNISKRLLLRALLQRKRRKLALLREYIHARLEEELQQSFPLSDFELRKKDNTIACVSNGADEKLWRKACERVAEECDAFLEGHLAFTRPSASVVAVIMPEAHFIFPNIQWWVAPSKQLQFFCSLLRSATDIRNEFNSRHNQYSKPVEGKYCFAMAFVRDKSAVELTISLNPDVLEKMRPEARGFGMLGQPGGMESEILEILEKLNLIDWVSVSASTEADVTVWTITERGNIWQNNSDFGERISSSAPAQ